MSQPSEPAYVNFEVDTGASSLLVKVVVGNFVGPEDVGDISQTAIIVKSTDFVYVPFDNPPTFRAIQ